MNLANPNAVVIGSSGGIGAALSIALEQRGMTVARLSRSHDGFDITEEGAIRDAAARLVGPVSLVLVASGVLHDDRVAPEKSMRDLSADTLLRYYQVNSVGPALVAKHFLPLLPRQGRSIFAALSARVGSISDNRLGGWYGYRASKAALNQLIRTLAVELRRTRPDAFCVGLHPGTVDTGLSQPFQRNVAELFTPAGSAERLLDVLAGLSTDHSGRSFAWDGAEIAP